MKTDAVQTTSSCFNCGFYRKLEASSKLPTSPPSDWLGFPGSVGSGAIESRRKGVPLAVSSHTFSCSTELCDDQLTSPSSLPPFLPPPPQQRAIVVSGLPHGVASDAICTTSPGVTPPLVGTNLRRFGFWAQNHYSSP